MGTLRSDNSDVLENVSKKQTLQHFFSRLFQGAQLLKRREFGLELKKRHRARVQTQMVEFIALPFPFPNILKIWSFHGVVVQRLLTNVQKSVIARAELLFRSLNKLPF